jgi:UBX domain-containing protein 1
MSSETNFMQITGASQSVAKQYLEMSNGDIERAIDLYYSGAAPSKPAPAAPQRPTQPGPQRGVPAPRPAQPAKSNNDLIKDIFDKAANQGPPPEDDPSGANAVKHKITFYKNGFTVDDGEFRDNDDPANAEFLASIEKGQVPRELANQYQAVDVEIDDQREKPYKKPKAPFNPFAGKAHTIGEAAAKPKPAQPAPAAAPDKPLQTNYAVEGQPSTKIRVQFQDGSILTLTVNHSTTIANLRIYIHEHRPELPIMKMQLKCTFPPKELKNNQATVIEEGLKMATISATY